MPKLGDESKIAALLLSVFPVDCVCRPAWHYKVQIRRSPAREFRYTLLAGSTPCTRKPLTPEAVEAVFHVLAQANWLDSPDLAGRGRGETLRRTRRLIEVFGDLGFRRVLPDPTPGEPDESPVPEEAIALLAEAEAITGLFASDVDRLRAIAHRPPAGHPSLAGIVGDLQDLRTALLVACAARLRDTPFLARFNARRKDHDWHRLSEADGRFASAKSRDIAAARVWFANQLGGLGLPVWREGRFSGPHRLDDSPKTPLQFLWVALAVAAGAVLAPPQVPRLANCANPPCQASILLPETLRRPPSRYCSDDCRNGRRAADATTRRRAAQRTNPAGSD